MIDLVVLAAGRGRRLGALGDEVPKWLLEVAGTTLAERQLEGVRRATQHLPGLVRSVHVVVGHAAPAVASFAATCTAPAVVLVDNPAYDELNNWHSLLRALRALDGAERAAERVVVFNADLLAHPDWFARFLLDSAEPGAADALIAVDTERPLSDESMKVSTRDGDPDRLEAIGKVGVANPVGEYVGMFMVRGRARERLRASLEAYTGSADAVDHWYEHAIGDTAAEDVDWTVWPTPDSEWIEIDDEADYAAALRVEAALR